MPTNIKVLSAPPFVMLYYAVVIWLVRDSLSFNVMGANWLFAFIPIGLGLMLVMWARYHFKRAKTTTNPFKVKEVSSLVKDGPFRFSRNPMYLGMAMVLCGISLGAGTFVGFALVAFFVQYINRAQIYREEKAMAELFGADWKAYCQKVRAWI